MKRDEAGDTAALRTLGPILLRPAASDAAADAVGTLYQDTAALILTGIRLGPTAGIVSGSHYRPIPWYADIQDAAWSSRPGR